MAQIQKTVFISYRRTNFPWARAIYEHLRNAGYDVFMDLESINSGSFERITLANIHARAHFIVILTPSAMDRCMNENDWLRKEIREAIQTKRNIIPLFIEGFDFYSVEELPDDIDAVREYNGLKVYSEYYEAAMRRLKNDFLNIALEDVPHPTRLSKAVTQATKERQQAVNGLPEVTTQQLTAQAWFERGYQAGEGKEYEEAEQAYRKVIELDPQFAIAHNNLGILLKNTRRMDEAEQAYRKAIELDPQSAQTHNNLGILLSGTQRTEEAEKAYRKAIELDPQDPTTYNNLGVLFLDTQRKNEAEQAYRKAIELDPQDATAYYNFACLKSLQYEIEKAYHWLEEAFDKGFQSISFAWQDADLENLRQDRARFTQIVGPEPERAD